MCYPLICFVAFEAHIICSSATNIGTRELAEFFWRLLSSILPMTAERVKRPQSAQLFEASLSVLRTMGEFWRDALDLESYVADWGGLLMEHEHEEVCLPNTP